MEKAITRITKNLGCLLNKRLKVIYIGDNISDFLAAIDSVDVELSILCVKEDGTYATYLQKDAAEINSSKIKDETEKSNLLDFSGTKAKVHADRNKSLKKIHSEDPEVVNFGKLDEILLNFDEFSEVDLIKINSFEKKVLEGSSLTISKNLPYIFINAKSLESEENDYIPKDITNYLLSLGYDQFIVYDNVGLIRDILHSPEEQEFIKLFSKVDFNQFDILALSPKHKSINLQCIANELLEYSKILHERLCSIESGEITKKTLNHEVESRITELCEKTSNEFLKHLDSLTKKIIQLEKDLFTKDSLIDSLHKEIEKKNKDILEITSALESTKNEIQKKEREHKIELDFLRNEIQKIYNSKTWRYREKILNLRKTVLKSLLLLKRTSKKVKSYLKKGLKDNFKVFFLKQTSKPKIVYIDHGYHKNTNSNKFLQDFLSEYFEITYILDHSWEGKAYPDLTFVDKSYYAVIFFQSPPPDDVDKNLKCKNKIFIPMFDGYGSMDDNFWYKFRNYKIVNFSKTLHKRVSDLGLDSIYVQYFPKPGEFAKGEENTVFFWQRHSNININTVIEILKKNKGIKIHIHKKTDPNHSFVEPTPDQISEYQITMSDWFEKKEDVLKIISSKQIYIAPRDSEGIGLSFLEAMSMGKVVIACDKPTMNEYIKHGETGFLFNLHNLSNSDIVLTNLEQIQRNTYNYITKGHEEWLMNRKKIVEHINY
ncbi:glycosyltransferase [Candidatus Dojkabacteria bacterium]|uniref:Glycosyltransferase n=1 Tax=Candidatus Dojkabacteria bacterium TaxID=2099670 RepID=A0A3M0Z328_9BACT|nr:MAG: glycosyltransferase [Candidatus Dojkabacteria bacterium]